MSADVPRVNAGTARATPLAATSFPPARYIFGTELQMSGLNIERTRSYPGIVLHSAEVADTARLQMAEHAGTDTPLAGGTPAWRRVW